MMGKVQGDIEYVMFENDMNNCFADCAFVLLAHNKTVQQIVKDFPDSDINKIIVAYSKAVDAMNDKTVDSRDKRKENAKEILLEIQKNTYEVLKHKMKFEVGEPDSAFCALLNLIIRDQSNIKHFLNISWLWVQNCSSCGRQSKSKAPMKPIITLQKVKEFKPECPVSLYTCSCNSEQGMKLQYKELPPCFIFHFENGAGDDKNFPLSFILREREYQLTGVVTMEKSDNLNHFITWIRDPASGMWLNRDDLNLEPSCFTKEQPSVNMRDIYLYIYESLGQLQKVKHEETSDEEWVSEKKDVVVVDLEEEESEREMKKKQLAPRSGCENFNQECSIQNLPLSSIESASTTVKDKLSSKNSGGDLPLDDKSICVERNEQQESIDYNSLQLKNTGILLNEESSGDNGLLPQRKEFPIRESSTKTFAPITTVTGENSSEKATADKVKGHDSKVIRQFATKAEKGKRLFSKYFVSVPELMSQVSETHADVGRMECKKSVSKASSSSDAMKSQVCTAAENLKHLNSNSSNNADLNSKVPNTNASEEIVEHLQISKPSSSEAMKSDVSAAAENSKSFVNADIKSKVSKSNAHAENMEHLRHTSETSSSEVMKSQVSAIIKNVKHLNLQSFDSMDADLNSKVPNIDVYEEEVEHLQISKTSSSEARKIEVSTAAESAMHLDLKDSDNLESESQTSETNAYAEEVEQISEAFSDSENKDKHATGIKRSKEGTANKDFGKKKVKNERKKGASKKDKDDGNNKSKGTTNRKGKKNTCNEVNKKNGVPSNSERKQDLENSGRKDDVLANNRTENDGEYDDFMMNYTSVIDALVESVFAAFVVEASHVKPNFK